MGRTAVTAVRSFFIVSTPVVNRIYKSVKKKYRMSVKGPLEDVGT